MAILGINSWKKEIKWKRKRVIAEKLLTSIYKSLDEISKIRNPIVFNNEGYGFLKELKDSRYNNGKPNEIDLEEAIVMERLIKYSKATELVQNQMPIFLANFGYDNKNIFDEYFNHVKLLHRVALNRATTQREEDMSQPEALKKIDEYNRILIASNDKVKDKYLQKLVQLTNEFEDKSFLKYLK